MYSKVRVLSRKYAWNKRVQRGKNGANGQRVQRGAITAYQHEDVYVMDFSVPVILLIYMGKFFGNFFGQGKSN